MPAVSPLPAASYQVWVTTPQGAKIEQVGGSYDDPSAVAIACTAWQAVHVAQTSTKVNVGVFDNSNVLIAYIGRS